MEQNRVNLPFNHQTQGFETFLAMSKAGSLKVIFHRYSLLRRSSAFTDSALPGYGLGQ
jgi:hypothetical protein